MRKIFEPNECAGVGVAFDAMPFHEDYPVLRRLAEAVLAIGRDSHHRSFEREIMLLRHLAAPSGRAASGGGRA